MLLEMTIAVCRPMLPHRSTISVLPAAVMAGQLVHDGAIGRVIQTVNLAPHRVSAPSRPDWFTPDGLPTWGDGRLFILGTEGYIELRKYVDIAGRPGGNHLFIADKKGVRYMDCSKVPLPFGPQFITDIVEGTSVAQDQDGALLAAELVLTAEARATRATR
jgi:hypothetical protein